MTRFEALVIAILIGISSAAAQTVWTSTGAPHGYSNCCANGACWLENGNICHSDPNQRLQLFFNSGGEVTSITNNGGGISITNSTSAITCDEGWMLVMRTGGTPACAKELKEPR